MAPRANGGRGSVVLSRARSRRSCTWHHAIISVHFEEGDDALTFADGMIEGIALGHGGFGDDLVASHALFGSREAVEAALTPMRGWADGAIELDPSTPVVRDASSGLVCGLREHEEGGRAAGERGSTRRARLLHVRAADGKRHIARAPQPFPYQLPRGTVHSAYWMTTAGEEWADERITEGIAEKTEKHHGGSEFVCD